MLDETGRWPLVYWAPGAWAEVVSGALFDRKFFEFTDRGSDITADVSLKGLLARAEALDLEAALREVESWEWRRKYLDDEVSQALKTSMDRFGQAPPESDVRRAAGLSADPVLGIERFLLDWELGLGLSSAKETQWLLVPIGRLGEPQPPPEEPAFLFLLPTTVPWEVYAHIEGLFNLPSDQLIRAERGWHQAYGAEPMAIFMGSSTQLLVPRPPSKIELAWVLAREHYLLASDTLMLQGHRLRDYARALMQASYWDLWSKP